MCRSDAVELSLRFNRADLVAGYTAVYRSTHRWLRYRTPLGVVVIVCSGLLIAVGGAWPLAAASVLLGALNVLPWRMYFHLPVRRLLRDNPQWSGLVTFRLDDGGVQVRAQGIVNQLTWDVFPYYQETDSAFLLRMSTGPRSEFQVLPRRALADPLDEARLGDLLARHCRRMESRPGWLRRPDPAPATVELPVRG